MLFNSIQFLIFFVVVFLTYYKLSLEKRWVFLLLASCFFYMAFVPVYIFILLITILIDYFGGIYIEKTSGKTKKILLIISILSTCLVLFIFKYYNFFFINFEYLAKFFNINYSSKLLNIILPIGLSFHTFQSLCYVIEVYRGNQKAEHNFIIYALYVMYFPQLVAGPIERAKNLLPQLKTKQEFDYKGVTDGLKLALWGFFKKLVIADNAASIVNTVYNNAHQFSGWPLIIATYLFAFQIYCDFSGYSDIAIGISQTLGIKLMDNFNRPYFSKSVTEFWRRWHISLSTWFMEYVYIPLGGNRVKPRRWAFNIMTVFVVSGLWHGANWTYLVWGFIHGVIIVFERVIHQLRQKLIDFFAKTKLGENVMKIVMMAITFNLVCLAWIFFRANSIGDAIYITTHLFTGLDFGSIQTIGIAAYLKQILSSLAINTKDVLIIASSIIFMEFIHSIQRHTSIRHMLASKPVLLRWGIYYVMILAIIFFGYYGNVNFIYFQF